MHLDNSFYDYLNQNIKRKCFFVKEIKLRRKLKIKNTPDYNGNLKSKDDKNIIMEKQIIIYSF